MISILIVGVLFVLIIVFCVLSAKQWHWANIVFLILCYLAGVAASVGLSQVLDKRREALNLVKQSELELYGEGVDSNSNGLDDAIDVEQVGGADSDGDGISDGKANLALQNQVDYVIYGPPDTSAYSPTSLRGLSDRYKLQMHGRGRLWASGKVTADGGNRLFTFSEARPIINAEADIKPPQMVGAELYAFLDDQPEAGGTIYPTKFIGSMRVVSETTQAWVLEPLFVASQEEFSNMDMTWSLYEKMPMDRHDTFLNIEKFDISEDAQKGDDFMTNLTAYRKTLEEKYLPSDQVGFPVGSADDEIAREARINYERFIDKICFDGLGFSQIESWVEIANNEQNRVSGDFVADPTEIFFKYKITKKTPSDRPYIVDAKGDVESEGPFTKNGQAIDPAIHFGNDGQVLLQQDDVILVDQLNANGFQLSDDTQIAPFRNRETVEDQGDNQERVFVRQLFDFPRMLKDLKDHSDNLTKNNGEMQVKISVAETNASRINTQLQARLEITKLLEEDHSVLSTDVDRIKALLDASTIEAQRLKDEIAKVQKQIEDRRKTLGE